MDPGTGLAEGLTPLSFSSFCLRAEAAPAAVAAATPATASAASGGAAAVAVHRHRADTAQPSVQLARRVGADDPAHDAATDAPDGAVGEPQAEFALGETGQSDEYDCAARRWRPGERAEAVDVDERRRDDSATAAAASAADASTGFESGPPAAAAAAGVTVAATATTRG